ncbi:hypothetical protein PO656_22735, partial [Enterobacter kobei]|uniref:hypothetical protein n=1 Tax=Enterobacter kobei TaxID=208224 RepID=UPI0020735005
KRAYCLKTQPATGETYPKSDLFNKAGLAIKGRDSPESIVFYSYAHKYSPEIHPFSTLPSKIKRWFL